MPCMSGPAAMIDSRNIPESLAQLKLFSWGLVEPADLYGKLLRILLEQPDLALDSSPRMDGSRCPSSTGGLSLFGSRVPSALQPPV